MEFIKKLMVTNITLSKEVSGFSFPNDWYKIRQMMEERRRKEQVCSDKGDDDHDVDDDVHCSWL